MMYALDPSPHEDLPSDITFGAWLASLDPAKVLLDLEPALTGADKWRLKYLRRKLAANKTSPTPVVDNPERRER